jgi:hypothetical protein
VRAWKTNTHYRIEWVEPLYVRVHFEGKVKYYGWVSEVKVDGNQ